MFISQPAGSVSATPTTRSTWSRHSCASSSFKSIPSRSNWIVTIITKSGVGYLPISTVQTLIVLAFWGTEGQRVETKRHIEKYITKQNDIDCFAHLVDKNSGNFYSNAKYKIEYQTFRGCCLFISGMLQLNKTRASYETNLNKFKLIRDVTCARRFESLK